MATFSFLLQERKDAESVLEDTVHRVKFVCQSIKRQNIDPHDFPSKYIRHSLFCLLNVNKHFSTLQNQKHGEKYIRKHKETQRTGNCDSGRCCARGEGLSHYRPSIRRQLIKILCLSPSYLNCRILLPQTQRVGV